MRVPAVVSGLCVAGSGAVAQTCPPYWSAGTGSNVNGTVYALKPWDSDGPGPAAPRVAVGGDFTLANGATSVNRIALWTPSSTFWTALSSGVSGTAAPSVYALAVLANNDLVAGGDFTTAGGTAVGNIAGWNGTAWYTLFGGTNDTVRALALMSDGTLAAGGEFTQAGAINPNRIARFFGPAIGWGSFGAGSFYDVVSLAALPGVNLVAGSTGSGAVFDHINRWNGSAWAPVGPGIGTSVRAIAIMANGDIVAGGTFNAAGGTPANHIARWNGSAWVALGSGMNDYVNALAVLPGGELVAGGHFTMAGGVPCNRIAQWNGSAWSPLDSGVNNVVHALAAMPNGNLVVGGSFTMAGGQAAGGIATWARPPSCYANCDCSGNNVQWITSNDYVCFLNAFAGGLSYANCDGSTGLPALTPNDFQCFLNTAIAGCS
jgi:trimeric autotransporter adhesin